MLDRIKSAPEKLDKVKVGLEATGHYSHNILGFLLDKGLTTYVINRSTQAFTGKVSACENQDRPGDARTIATIMISDVSLKPYIDTLYNNEELSSLTRYRFDKVLERAKLKQSFRSS